MKQKLKAVIRKIVQIKILKKCILLLLRCLLPGVLLLKLKRKLSFWVYNTSQPSKMNEAYENVFSLVQIENQKRKVDLVICCAFTGRYEILETSIMESISSRSGYVVEWFLCGTTPDDLKFIETLAKKTKKVSGIIWRNNPLGEKWHFCVKTAGKIYDAELYAINGSDDIISSKLVQNILDKHQSVKQSFTAAPESEPSHLAMYCTNQWVIIKHQADISFPSAIHCSLKQTNYYVPLGAGRFYTKEFMHQVDFHLFDTSRENCLDDYGYLKINELGYRVDYYNLDDGLLMSVKGNWHKMNLIDDILEAESIEVFDYNFDIINKLNSNISSETLMYIFKTNALPDKFAWC